MLNSSGCFLGHWHLTRCVKALQTFKSYQCQATNHPNVAVRRLFGDKVLSYPILKRPFINDENGNRGSEGQKTYLTDEVLTALCRSLSGKVRRSLWGTLMGLQLRLQKFHFSPQQPWRFSPSLISAGARMGKMLKLGHKSGLSDPLRVVPSLPRIYSTLPALTLCLSSSDFPDIAH